MANHIVLFSLFRLLRWLGRFTLLVYFVVGIGLLGVRYWLLPNVDQWRSTLQHHLTEAVGSPVTLGEVKAQWIGANPRLTLSDVTVTDQEGNALLRLPFLRASLGWRSLFGGPIRFNSLELMGVDLAIRRDSEGRLHLVGQAFELSSDDMDDDALPPAVAWLFMQRRILLTDATLRWVDDLRASQTLTLNRVRIQLDNDGRNRRLALQAAPPAALASMLDVRVEVNANNVKDRLDRLDQLSGRVYVNARDVQSQAWRPWLDLPQALASGEGTVQATMAFDQGKPGKIALDISANDLHWRLHDKDFLKFDCARLHAEGSWQSASDPVALQWQGHGVSVSLAQFYDHPLSFDDTRLQAVIKHTREAPLSVTVQDAQLTNADADINFSGHWQSSALSEAGLADIRGRATRISVPAIVRYLPSLVNPDARRWMQRALSAGQLSEVDFLVRGKLDAFPFGDNPADGDFLLDAVVKDTRIDYSPPRQDEKGWPALENMSGTLSMQRESLTLHAETAQLRSDVNLPPLQLQDVSASLPNFGRDTRLRISGDTSGAAASYIALVQRSPLGELIGGVLDDAVASGDWQVPVSLEIPLMHSIDTQVNGSVLFGENANLRLMPGMPVVEALSGALAFTEKSVVAQNIKGRFLGGPLEMQGGIGAGQSGFRLQGEVTAAALAQFVGLEGMQRFSGRTSFSARLGLNKDGQFALEADSSLEGLGMRLPEPLTKSVSQALPLQVHWRPWAQASGIAALDIWLGANLHARALRRHGAVSAAPYFHALSVGFGRPTPSVADGMHIDVLTARFDAQAWNDVVDEFSKTLQQSTQPDRPVATATSRKGPLLPTLQHFRVQSDQGRIFGLGTTQMTLTAQRTDPSHWRMDISSTETAGTLFWREANGRVEGSILARLDRLAIGGEGAILNDDTQVDVQTSLPDELDIPAIDLEVNRFTFHEHMLGKLIVSGVNQQRGHLWRLDRFSIDSPAASLSGKGVWQLSGEDRGLQLQAEIHVRNLGDYLTQAGFSDVMQEGNGEIKMDLFWRNLPWSLQASDIRGTLELSLDKGRFNQVNSRVARLLELLSLQSVKRLASLNFNPGGLLKNGFPFDVLRGHLELNQGILQTRDYRVVGPVGTIVIGGNTHLLEQTVDLRAVVIPNLDVSGAAVAAGIAVNPVVGVGAFLAQWLLQAPLSRAMTVEYHVTGNWDDVKIEDISASRAQSGQDTASTP